MMIDDEPLTDETLDNMLANESHDDEYRSVSRLVAEVRRLRGISRKPEPLPSEELGRVAYEADCAHETMLRGQRGCGGPLPHTEWSRLGENTQSQYRHVAAAVHARVLAELAPVIEAAGRVVDMSGPHAGDPYPALNALCHAVDAARAAGRMR